MVGNGRAAFATAAKADSQAFTADPPPKDGDAVLKPWATRQFEALQRRVGELQAAVDALEAAVDALEAANAAQTDRWDP